MGQALKVLSELEELETAITYLRARQKQLKEGPKDPQKAQFIKEWLIDLYIIRKNHPEYISGTHNKTSMNDDVIIDSDLVNKTAKTDFIDPFEMSLEYQDSAIVRELLDGLTVMEHEAVKMCWLNGLGPTEAAYWMGCSARNVSTYLIRARTKMIEKYQSFSQMVLVGFDVPPTVRKRRIKNTGDNTARENGKKRIQKRRKQLTLFQE